MNVKPVVKEFLILLGKADSVRVESPLLTWWDTYDPEGEASHVVAEFSWVESNKNYRLSLSEGGIANGKWIGESFFCEDSEGRGVEISLFRHVGITPNA